MFRRAFKAVQRSTNAVLLTLLNSLVLFAVLNIGIALYANSVAPHKATTADKRRVAADQALAKYGIDYFKRIYPNKSEAEIRQLIADQAELPPAIYEPYAEYRPPAATSPTYNVHEAGFRLIGAGQGPWPLDPNALNVFVFGGSEVLGAGVADDETIPADIQKLLRERTEKSSVNVYNFAVQAYNSSQDVTYFQNQLRYGNIPDIAIFMEGPVDFERWDGVTTVSGIYRDYLSWFYQLNSLLGLVKDFGWHLEELVRSLPIVTFIQQHYGQTDEPATAAPQSSLQTA